MMDNDNEHVSKKSKYKHRRSHRSRSSSRSRSSERKRKISRSRSRSPMRDYGRHRKKKYNRDHSRSSSPDQKRSASALKPDIKGDTKAANPIEAASLAARRIGERLFIGNKEQTAVNTSSGFQPRQSTSSGSDSRNQHSSFAKGHDKWIPFGVQHNHSVDKKEPSISTSMMTVSSATGFQHVLDSGEKNKHQSSDYSKSYTSHQSATSSNSIAKVNLIQHQQYSQSPQSLPPVNCVQPLPFFTQPPPAPNYYAGWAAYGMPGMPFTGYPPPPIVPFPSNGSATSSTDPAYGAFYSCPVPPPPPLSPPPPPPPSTQQESNLNLNYCPPPPPPPAPVPKLIRPTVLCRCLSDLRKLPKGWGGGTVGRYQIVEQVGEGTYGQVYKAREHNSSDLVALKKVRLENEKEGFPITAVREIKILRQLDHDNIVKLLDIVTDQPGQRTPGHSPATPFGIPRTPSALDLMSRRKNMQATSSFYLVFEYAAHDLSGLLDVITCNELQMASLMKQLFLALSYCHSHGFLHRDLKCSNILISRDGQLKLADFGLARLYQEEIRRLYTNRVITLWYRPPELLLGEERYGPMIDIWSAGCILAELFTKKAIFQGNVEHQQLEIIAYHCGSISPEVWPDVINLPNYHTMRPRGYHPRRIREKFTAYLPQLAIELLDSLLQLDPSKRPTASQALNHAWLADVDPKTVEPLCLPSDQDCHEMWSKRTRAQRKEKKNATGI